jgi:hypothetical protein
MIEKSSINFDLSLHLLSYSRCSHIKHSYININSKALSTFLSIEDIESFDEDVDRSRMHEYREKIRSVCYSAVINRSDIVKVVSKLTEHLINSKSTHLAAVNHLIRYLYKTKHLTIKFDVSKNEELIADQANENQANEKHVFEATADAAFANEKERKSAEEYTFKLLDDLID